MGAVWNCLGGWELFGIVWEGRNPLELFGRVGMEGGNSLELFGMTEPGQGWISWNFSRN